MSSEKLQTLQEHFAELRTRLIFCVIFFAVSFCISYFFSEKIYEFLLQPFSKISVDNQIRKLIYTSPTEAFTTYLKLSFYSAVFFSWPIFAAEIYLFLSPALYKNEKKNILIIFSSITFLFLLGAIFAFYFILPSALQLFSSYENQGVIASSFSIHFETRISEYLNFVTNFILAFGIAFQLPILLLFLIRVGSLTVTDLKRRRKYWIVIIFIVAAILTPPDVLSQLSLALPMIILFEAALLIGKKINKQK